MKKFSRIYLLLPVLLVLTIFCIRFSKTNGQTESDAEQSAVSSIISYENVTEANPIQGFSFNIVPEYRALASYEINGNIPFITDDMLTTKSYEIYPELDELGRCRTVVACLSRDTMPAENETRDEIGQVKPSGWQTIKYPELISGLYLYNRCHLIGWQLSNENANINNLVTGTRYMNVVGMLPYENKVADYIKTTGNHVIYRVTPVFLNNELVCRGVLIESRSVENDDCTFCVYCYNVQPGIIIDYLSGSSKEDPGFRETPDSQTDGDKAYILNKKSKKIHTPDCESAKKINIENKQEYIGNIQELLDSSYTPCSVCNPT